MTLLLLFLPIPNYLLLNIYKYQALTNNYRSVDRTIYVIIYVYTQSIEYQTEEERIYSPSTTHNYYISSID